MERNLSFFEGEHLFPVTKKQIEELNFGRLGARSKTFEIYLKRRSRKSEEKN